jgi:hypothetical protein
VEDDGASNICLALPARARPHSSRVAGSTYRATCFAPLLPFKTT